jgi:hypothetical protein
MMFGIMKDSSEKKNQTHLRGAAETDYSMLLERWRAGRDDL